jgi:5'-3' exonuclease
MKVYLIDGTYELFRYYYALPSVREGGVEVAALRGVVGSVLGLINSGVTHLAVATDHVIESFRNRLWRGYKTSAGVEPELLAQFHPLEDALRSLGVVVWPMVEFEADDALASGAALAERDARVERVVICTPDKDLGQSVRGTRVVQLDRRRNLTRDEAGVVSKFGVAPASIPDYLALVGDSSDGYPGLPGWGSKSAGAVLAKFEHLEAIPPSVLDWQLDIRNASRLAATLAELREEALLYRTLAILKRDSAIGAASLDELEWRGVPRAKFLALCEELGLDTVRERVHRWAD